MIIFADTFNTYGSDVSLLTNGLYGVVSQAGLATDPDPNVPVGRHVFQAFSNAVVGLRLRRVFPGARVTAGFAKRLWLDQLPPNSSCVPSFTFLDAGNNPMVSLTVDPIGRIAIHTGYGAGAVIGITPGPVVTANAYQHIEFKSTAGISGSFEVRVNGTPVLTGTGNTGVGSYYQYGIDNASGSSQTLGYSVKDLVVWDSTGTYNTDFLGSVNVLDLLPDSDIAFPWTPSSGATGYNLINDLPPNDASYIQAAFPLPAASVFGIQNLPADVTSVKAMISCVRVEKIDGGDGNLQASLKSGASTALGSDRPVTVAFTYYQDIFEVDPATSAPWTPTAADAAQLQLNRTV